MTKSAMRRLGERLSASSGPSDEDLRQLQDVERAYGEALSVAVERVRTIVAARAATPDRLIQITSRVKTVATLLDKVRRGSALGRIYDIAGMRVVGAFGFAGQDEIVREVVAAFEWAKVADRPLEPSAPPPFGDALRACGSDNSRLVLNAWNEAASELGLP